MALKLRRVDHCLLGRLMAHARMHLYFLRREMTHVAHTRRVLAKVADSAVVVILSRRLVNVDACLAGLLHLVLHSRGHILHTLAVDEGTLKLALNR